MRVFLTKCLDIKISNPYKKLKLSFIEEESKELVQSSQDSIEPLDDAKLNHLDNNFGSMEIDDIEQIVIK